MVIERSLSYTLGDLWCPNDRHRWVLRITELGSRRFADGPGVADTEPHTALVRPHFDVSGSAEPPRFFERPLLGLILKGLEPYDSGFTGSSVHVLGVLPQGGKEIYTYV